MRKFIVEAKSHQSAEWLYSVLSAFSPELDGDDQSGYRVSVSLGGKDQLVVDLLNVLERHVNERRDGPARLELEGRKYMMHPTDGAATPSGG